jgi:hypothetical protein
MLHDGLFDHSLGGSCLLVCQSRAEANTRRGGVGETVVRR